MRFFLERRVCLSLHKLNRLSHKFVSLFFFCNKVNSLWLKKFLLTLIKTKIKSQWTKKSSHFFLCVRQGHNNRTVSKYFLITLCLLPNRMINIIFVLNPRRTAILRFHHSDGVEWRWSLCQSVAQYSCNMIQQCGIAEEPTKKLSYYMPATPPEANRNTTLFVRESLYYRPY